MENKEPMSFYDALLYLIFFGLFHYCMLNGYYLFLGIFPTISALMLYRNWQTVVAQLKWTWRTFIVSTIALFAGRIFAVQHYNGKYGIYPEYLNYSISIWALVVAISTFTFIPIFYWSIVFTIKTYKNNKFFNMLKNISHCATCILTCFALSYAYPYAEQYDAHLLLLDSYAYSDCNPPEGTVAIRKNDAACYQISWQPGLGFDLMEYPAPKP